MSVLVLLILIASILIFRGLGFVGVGALASWPVAARYGLAIMLLLTSSAHFTPMKEDLIRMTPRWVPRPRAMVLFTGICEIAGAIGLAIPRSQRAAGIALILFFIAVLPANIHAARAGVALRGRPATALWLRIPMQILFIGLTAWSTGAVSVRAQAREPMPLAHGNVPGEPHHHLKIENEYVRVYYVEVPPHENTFPHQHDNDYLFVTLGPSDVVNAVRGKPEVHLVLKDGETHFTRGGFAHVARNLAGTPFRNVTIELLKPQGEAHNLCSQFIPSAPIGPCDKKSGLEPQFDTSGITVDLLRFDPETTIAETTMKYPCLIVALRNSGIGITAKRNLTKVLQEGEMEWFDPGSSAKFLNSNSKSATFMRITFIDALSHAKPLRPVT